MPNTRGKFLLRVAVTCLVVGVAVKVLSPHRSAETVPDGQKQPLTGGDFWSKSSGKKEEVVKLKEAPAKKTNAPQEVPPKEEDAGAQAPNPEPSRELSAPLRIVHLDLKGAAPKVKYLEQIFPLFSSLGATGVLMEYEDMFPYQGDLKILQSPHAYSLEDIKQIRNLAKLSNLEVIPLVQVFGHLEFVLKHEAALVKDMVTQVLEQHPDSSWFHMGADEVFGLGESQDSKNWLHSNNGDKGRMYLNHVTAVARFIKEKRPAVGLLMWDDMMRQIGVDVLKESGLQNLASPMIWFYSPELNLKAIDNLISKYQEVGFKGVWFASAFKGASDIAQIWTPLGHHLNNHLSWVKVISSMSKYPSISFRGIVLTGWQRYEHFTVLCEILPVAIPSLAVCLQSLVHGEFADKAQLQTQHILGCKIEIDKGICEGSGAFAGSQVYNMVLHISRNLQKQTDDLMKDYNVRGSFTHYHRKYNFANPRNLGFFMEKLKKLLDEWETYMENFRSQMEAIFFPDTVEEWMDENVNRNMDRLRKMVGDAERIMKLKGRPKSH
ncbi:hypothetical protein MATL_G00210820 [Megalops atlanticus]|uniref:Beta-N-acetylhexosaminidase n=1 Tax=Megalops atlanticus TaxID=7932 RepID=A0A9D3SZ47_MEGAT|nr:hypothetical protein MATL_G00210820 [Megalops atlanticus]